MTHRAEPASVDSQCLRQEIQRHVSLGQLDQALQLCSIAIEKATAGGDQNLADRVYCNRASILIARGTGEEAVPELRRILLRSSDLQNRFSASYHISHFYDLQRESRKSLFYARQSLRYAQDFGETEAQICALNAIANLLILDSHFDQAEAAYAQALDFHRPDDGLDRAILLANIGYCQIVTGSLGSGYRRLTESLRMMRRLGATSWQHLPRLGLAYACLEVQRYDRARNHARRALELAEDSQISGGIKNALYLLGEAEKLCGHLDAAYERFFQLQSRFYPDNPMVIDVLMSADVRKLINLMA